MIDSILGCHLEATFGPEKVAELRTSGYGLTELEVNGIWHDDCFLLYHFGQAQQVPNGDCMDVVELAGAMTHEPSNDCTGVLFVLNIEVKKRRRYSSSTW